MNWYNRLKFAQISGEYWIDDIGNAIFIDGDVGDYNHESYVMEQVRYKVADLAHEKGLTENNHSNDDFIDWDMFLQEIKRGTKDSVYNTLLKSGLKAEQLDVAFEQRDARAYAVEHWGWKRLEGTNVETGTLTPNDMDTIASGLYNAYDEDATNQTYTIYVYSTNQTLDMTYEQLDNKEMAETGGLAQTQQKAYDKAVTELERKDQPSFYQNKPEGD